MEALNHIYRDPLFGIAVLIAMIAFAILADYYRNFYHKRKKEKSINALVKSYEHNEFFEGIAEFLKAYKDPIPTLLFLAKSYTRSGDNQQAIKIYLTLIRQIGESSLKIEILEGLAEAYFQSGLLQKSKEIFLEILANHPRDIKALFKLIAIHESLGEYQHALEALDCVEENLTSSTPHQENAKIALTRSYLKTQILLQDHHKSQNEKNTELLGILQTQEPLRKMILGYFKTYHLQSFWESLPSVDWEDYIDLLWDFSFDKIDQKTISQSPALEVFQAKGYYPSSGCKNFQLECLRLFHTHSSQRATIAFSYSCKHCFTEFPFDSFRCPNCNELGIMKLIIKPQKASNEKHFSLL